MLTDITTDIIETLVTKVRVLTTDQIAERWFCDLRHPKESANRAARKLEAEGLVTKSQTTIVKVCTEKPLLSWTPESNAFEPDFGSISYANQKRWNREPTATTILFSTSKADKLFGGTQRIVRHTELSHDVAVAGVYLNLQRDYSTKWVLEDFLDSKRYGNKRPDAVIQTLPEIVIDVIGKRYSKSKIQEIWKHFSKHKLQLR